MTVPLVFRCPSCQQRLTAKPEKVGRRVKCPRCGGALVVPATAQPAPPPVQPTVNAADNRDDVIELPIITVGDEREPATRPQRSVQEPFDPTWVSFPRRLLYFHALVLAVIVVGAFALGYFAGRDQRQKTDAVPSAQSTGPIAVDGRVTYPNRANEQVGDDGAVVIALPRDRRPSRTEKPSLSGLGPRDPPPPDNDPVLEAIAALGGAYVRADQEGRFRLALPQPGGYYLLYISRNETRPESADISREDRAAMGEYFTSAAELIGRQRYAWVLQMLAADSDASYSFVGRPF